MRASPLTIPDLVVLSLVSERPMHGYEINLELERRDVRDWAGISRPQVYYSLKKLEAAGFIEDTLDGGPPSAGPERRVLTITPAGHEALADALERDDWAIQRPPPPFLTWLALSWKARPGVLRSMVNRRRTFLLGEITRERTTLQEIKAELGAEFPAPALMVDLTIHQFELELEWLKVVEDRLG
jgi:DNA-binding PadR family transcriptional regulator